MILMSEHMKTVRKRSGLFVSGILYNQHAWFVSELPEKDILNV